MSRTGNMKKSGSFRTLLYQLLLWCYPSHVCRESGREMAELFWDMSEAGKKRRGLPKYFLVSD